MKLTVTRMIKFDGESRLKAVCDVVVNDGLLLRGLRVVALKQGFGVTMPLVPDAKGVWADQVMFLTRHVKALFTHTILAAYNQDTP